MRKISGRRGAFLASALLFSGAILGASLGIAGLSERSALGGEPSGDASTLVSSKVALPAEKVTLSNGLTVFLTPDPKAVQVAVRIAIDIGSKDDPLDARGMAQVIGELLADPSTRHVPRDKRAALFQALGVREWETEVVAEIDSTVIELLVPPSDVALALWFQADRVGFFLDGASEDVIVEKEKLVGPRDWDARVMFRHGRKWLFGDDHPYGGFAAATQIEGPRVRAHARKYFVPRNMVIGVAGNFDPKAVKKQVEEMFGGLVDAPKPEAPKGFRPAITSERAVRVDGGVERPTVGLMWATPGFGEPEDQTLDNVAMVLAERLEKELVESKKVADRVIVQQATLRLSGAFNLEVRAAEGHDLSEIEPVVDAEIERMRKEGPTAAEVARASRRMLTSRLVALPRAENQAYWTTWPVMMGRDVSFVPEMIRRIETQSPEMVRAAAEKFLVKSQRVIVRARPRAANNAPNNDAPKNDAPQSAPPKGTPPPNDNAPGGRKPKGGGA